MKKHIITEKKLMAFQKQLYLAEKSEATVRKYVHDVKMFMVFLKGMSVSKENAILYKQQLIQSGYAMRSVNSVIASLNSYFGFAGVEECRIKSVKIQQQPFCTEEKELTRSEYERLVNTAARQNNQRLNLILQTICGTGIRVSELVFITAEAVVAGKAVVSMKGKTRVVFLVKQLQKMLLRYMEQQGIEKGCVFVTRTGKPVSRTNIWREMKQLCIQANVNPAKVFPHNLRHLFARIFYGIEKDIARLADILGHSSIDTTRIYIAVNGEEHRRRMENMKLII